MGTLFAFGVAVAGLAGAYVAGGGGWDGLKNLPANLWDSAAKRPTAYGTALGLGTAGYVAAKAARSSLEPSPAIQVGRVRGYLL